MRDKQPCGCVHDGTRWLQLCEPHQADITARAARAAARHIATAPPDFTPTPEYTALAAQAWLD